MNLSHKKFVFIYFMIIFVALLSIASINYIIDPGKIYHSKTTKLDKYIDALVNSSKYGISAEGWNERDVKVAVAQKKGNYECVILGSSHSMQLGLYTTPALNNLCTSTMNLSVSGGVLEDIIIFAQLIKQNDNIKKVIIDIDPWSLKFNMDSRWQKNKTIYKSFIESVGTIKNKGQDTYIFHLIKNLINLEYFIESLKYIRHTKMIAEKNKDIHINTSTNYIVGSKNAVTLSDGAHVYSATYILKQKDYNYNQKIDKAAYKISGKFYNPKALSLLGKLIKQLKEKDKKILFLLTPYHPGVFEQDAKELQYIKGVESKIRKFARLNDIIILGSYNPNIIGCTNSEFLDFMHPKIECLNKINFKINDE